MINYIICSYFTKNTPYEKVANEYLIPSLYKLNLEGHIQGVADLGSWSLNTSYKPTFLKEMLNQFPDRNIVYIDCDAIVHGYLDLFENVPEKYYIAAHILDREKWYNKPFPEEQKTELLSGTLWVRNCEESRTLLNQWEQQCVGTKVWEQKILQKIVAERSIPLLNIPLSYCYIHSMPNNKIPFVTCNNPVIEHFQKSRELRTWHTN